MNETMLQQISDVAWLVHQGEEKLGILNKDVQENFTYITGKDLVKFSSEHAVINHFGNSTLFEVQKDPVKTEADIFYIKGFEVDYSMPFIVDENNPSYIPDLPLYTKIEDSDIVYAAGYYCICFYKGWKCARAPKLSTILKYGYQGPFKTLLEAKQVLKRLNKK